MTKKLKRKMKKITALFGAVAASICVAIILSTDVFVMPMNSEEITRKTAEAAHYKAVDGVSEIMNTETKTVGNNVVAIASEGDIIECDSIVQGARDNNLQDGNYLFRVVGKNKTENAEILDYPVEIINYYEDVTYSLDEGQIAKTISLGDNTTDKKMLIVKYHKNLRIDKGVTVTANTVSNLTYKKGMYLCVMGELVNNGTISMTARGTYNQARRKCISMGK